MKAVALSAVVVVALSGCTPRRADTASVDASPRSIASFNAGWRFTKDDPPGTGDSLSYAKLKPQMLATATANSSLEASNPQSAIRNPQLESVGVEIPYIRPNFDDSGWRKLDLPHDWAIEGQFIQDEPGETGKLPYAGVGWYRKRFDVPAGDRGKQFYLDVDGAMSYGNVWINGHYAGGWPYGYTSWRVDLTPHIRFGGENVVAIRLDNPPKSSRWYPGGGIYRNVWLVKTAPVHIAHWGTQITTANVTSDSADVSIRVQIENCSAAEAVVNVGAVIQLVDVGRERSAEPVASTDTATLHLAANSSAAATLAAHIRQPQLWSIDQPSLYTAVVTVSRGANGSASAVDRCETTFGIRTIKFTPDEGFFLNGQLTEIHGVCLHHDLGPLGAAVNVRARERQLEKLKELGCNAIRTSHNPPEPELLDLCDRMGFVVMVEAFDAWRAAKRDNDYHLLFDDWHELDLRAMIRRDRNHPSVVLWSLGNEVLEQSDGANARLAKELADIAHDEDPTRPVCMALHIVDASTNGFQDAVDVFGYNYTPFGYAEFRKNNPKIPLVGSETSSCTSSRGEYFFPVTERDKRTGRVNYQVTSYDYSAPKWAMAPDDEFKGQDENPFVAGEFVWTGFDYLGEPTPYDQDATEMLAFTDARLKSEADEDLQTVKKIRVPSRSSYFGIFDLAGFRKDRFYIYQARWRPELPMAHILPHWNWPDRIGQVTPVHVYTSGDEGELFLNGRSLGRKKKAPLEYRLRWKDVVYEPGELKVVAYRKGQEWATDSVKTTGPPAALKLVSDRSDICADGRDLAFVTCSVVDAEGRDVPTADNPIHFNIEGPGKIVATDNGDPTSHEPFQSTDRNAFNGHCLAIIRATAGTGGTIELSAGTNGLPPGVIYLKCHSLE